MDKLNNWLPENEKNLLIEKTNKDHQECVRKRLNYIDNADTWEKARIRVIEVLAQSFSVNIGIFDNTAMGFKPFLKRQVKFDKETAENLLINTTTESYFNKEKDGYDNVNHNVSLGFSWKFNEYFKEEEKFIIRGIVLIMILETKRKITEVANNEYKEI